MRSEILGDKDRSESGSERLDEEVAKWLLKRLQDYEHGISLELLMVEMTLSKRPVRLPSVLGAVVEELCRSEWISCPKTKGTLCLPSVETCAKIPSLIVTFMNL